MAIAYKSGVPWDYVQPGDPKTGVRNTPTALGRSLGAELCGLAGYREGVLTLVWRRES